MNVISKRKYDDARKKSYMPVEDQIDAIVKCIKHMHENGIDVGQDILPVIAHRDIVKAKNPKPK